MAHYPVDLKSFALAKETTRGTAVAAPTKHLKVARDSVLDYSLEHVPNDNIHGINLGEYPPDAGRKVGVGKLKFDLEAQTIGEFLYSLMGTKSSTQVGTTTAYTHTFSVDTGTQHQSYSLFASRGVDYYVYNGAVVKRMEFEGDNKGKASVSADVLFRSETTTSSFTPTQYASDPLMFHQMSVEIADSENTNIGKWHLALDNQAEAIWQFNQSQDCADVICGKKFLVEGGFDMYFDSDDERDYFLGNTTKKIEFLLTGDLIAGASYYRAYFTLYDCRFTSVPFDSELEGGLLGASCMFKGFYSTSDSKAIDVVIGNTTTTY